ncbi:hypothetical protein FH609_029005 [Streptomyces sp. 3MP-14]|uniref:Uncharacterized protein n=1 Tax=Streptomyces mimosae TaxID=2586635 RepID=A0A5N5ZQP0_9ACTN|nr:hypothetical protein FH607_028980 [Streptomyces mimosae]KAB8172729.1 hypothetical protein FH609_029005 [Streptomyces sp. 3MP-14]
MIILRPHVPTSTVGLPCPQRPKQSRATGTAATVPEAVRQNEEVVPVNAVTTWVLPLGVTVGR